MSSRERGRTHHRRGTYHQHLLAVLLDEHFACAPSCASCAAGDKLPPESEIRDRDE